MFDRIFANYLVEIGKLSEQNVEVIFSTKEERRARLGVIAVSEKMLSAEQADEINQLQAVFDDALCYTGGKVGAAGFVAAFIVCALHGQIALMTVGAAGNKRHIEGRSLLDCAADFGERLIRNTGKYDVAESYGGQIERKAVGTVFKSL